MKKLLCCLLCCMLCLTGMPALAQEASADLTVQDTTLSLCSAAAEGDTLTVSLEENSTTGYTWQYNQAEDGTLICLGDEFTPGTDMEEVGAGGTRVFTFKGAQAGSAELVFSCTQAFDPFNVPVSGVTVKADVAADGTVTVASCDVTESAAISAKVMHLSDDEDEEAHLGMALGLGNTAELLLAENPSTGYTWQVTLPEGGVLAILTDGYLEPVGEEGVSGASGTHQWLWDARKPGEVTVTAAYSRVWESEAPLYQVEATYVVDSELHVTMKDVAVQQSEQAVEASSEAAMASDGAEGSITFKTPVFDLFLGRTAAIKPMTTEKAVRSKGYTYTSDDETIATVDKNGKVKAIAAGSTTVLVTSKAVPGVWARIPVNSLIPVKKVVVSAEATTIYAGETLRLTAACEPAEASRQTVTWKTSNAKIATVDENGLVTGLKKGNVTITATAADGSKVHGSLKVTIAQKAEAVSIKGQYLRAAVGGHVDNTAIFSPKNANAVDMVWSSSDERIATVTGKGMSVRCHGESWGQCTITGTTPDGALSTSFTLNVGSLRKAVTVTKVTLDKHGKPVLTIRNNSPLTMTSVTVGIRAYAYNSEPLIISRDGDGTVLKATYDPVLGAYEVSGHDFKLVHVEDLSNIGFMEAAVLDWNCEEGYQNNKGKTLNKYTVAENYRQWVSMRDNGDISY